MILQFCICAATGRDFLIFGFVAPRPLRAVIVDYETKTTSLRQRHSAISGAMGLSEEERQLLRQNLRIIEVRKLLRAGQSFPFPNGRSKDSEGALQNAEAFWRQFRAKYPADIYIFDPMRSMHGTDENDSSIESLLGKLRGFFPDSAVVVAHHLRKFMAGGREITLQADMRLWSDNARGSSAIKAHSDVIVCQERVMEEDQVEILYLGAFLKDGADVEPLKLVESDAESFFWEVTPDIPSHLAGTVAALEKAGRVFADYQAAAAALLKGSTKKPTAYRHLKELTQRGWLVQQNGCWELRFSIPANRRFPLLSGPISMSLLDFKEKGNKRSK